MRPLAATTFAFLIAWAGWEELGAPPGAARVDLMTEPQMPVRFYVQKSGNWFRVVPVDATLPIRSDVFYRDHLYYRAPNPKILEIVAADQYHYLLLEGSGSFHLPPGKYKIEAYRGLFYKPAEVEFELGPNETRKVTLSMRTWEGADRTEWISSDDHIHLTRSRKDDPVYLAWLEAEDLTVGNFLALQRQMDAAPQYAFGRAGEARRRGYSIRPGQELRNEFWGHINILGASELIRPMSTGTMYANTAESYPYPSLLFQRGRSLGGTTGYAHFFQKPQHSTIYLDAARGTIDFVEVLQFGVLKTEPWYELLNAGLKITGVAGSDFPVPLNGRRPWPHWLPLLGPERTLVKARPGESSYDTWARGVREGRVVVSNGPIVEISHDSAAGRVEAKAAFYRPLQVLEIVRNGEVIASAPGNGSAASLTVSAAAACPDSCWLAARTRAQKRDNEPEIHAHTNPVWLLKDGKPVRVASARRSLAAKWEEEIAFFRSAGIVFPNEANRREFFDAAEAALGELRKP
jgi:hypothetical protein